MPVRAPIHVALAALFALSPLLAASARAAQTLAVSGPYHLTQAMVDDDVAVWQIVAGRPLAPIDRQAIAAVDLSQFRREPAYLLADIRQSHQALPALRKADAVRHADLRESCLVNIYCRSQSLHMTPDEAQRMQAVISRYVPVVGVDAASGTVITQRDVDTWMAASRYVAGQAHVPGPGASSRALFMDTAIAPTRLGPEVRRNIANMERNWLAFQLIWPHEPATYPRTLMARAVAQVHRASAGGNSGIISEAGLALGLGATQYDEYPYALDPRLAMMKRASDARMRTFQMQMYNYTLQSRARSLHDFARKMNGQGPDPANINHPLSLPAP